MCLNERHVTQSDMSDDETNFAADIFANMLSSKKSRLVRQLDSSWLGSEEHRPPASEVMDGVFTEVGQIYRRECEKYWHHMKESLVV
jgi:hypothetical protein